ncbi:MAG: DUF3276 family protein [Bacteroidota bacterium]
MEGNERERFYTVPVKAGKRTYFFDVKKTKNGEMYLNITESKRMFDNRLGKYFYEKHTLFLYKEDYEKFANGLQTVLECIQTGVFPEIEVEETKNIEDVLENDNDFEKNY